MMNPMNYIGTAKTASYWRIRHGTKDTDTSLAIPAILALKLENNNCDVDLKRRGERDTAEIMTLRTCSNGLMTYAKINEAT